MAARRAELRLRGDRDLRRPRMDEAHRDHKRDRWSMTVIVIILSATPALLSLAGFGFGNARQPFSPGSNVRDPLTVVEMMYRAMSGSFTHTILEWTAFCAALFTTALAFLHFSVTRNMVTPVIGLALLASGCMDAFHTLAANRLITASAPNHEFIPFTWALSRTFNVLVLLGTASFLLWTGARSKRFGGTRTVWAIAGTLALSSYIAIRICATRADLPVTLYPDGIFTRPWDALALALYLAGGVGVFPILYRRFPGPFAFALWISVIPNVATQLHMTFGSSHLFDHHFNIAHFLKIFCYAIPFVGLMADYALVYRGDQARQRELEALNRDLGAQVKQRRLAEEELRVMNDKLEHENTERRNAEEALRKVHDELEQRVEERTRELSDRTTELARSNEELQQFAYVASHDLQEPLRMVGSFTQLLAKKYKGRLDAQADEYIHFAVDGAKRMKDLIQDLLSLSRLDTRQGPLQQVDCNEVLEAIREDLQLVLKESGARIHYDSLPEIHADYSQLRQLFQNLITNAIKFKSDEPSEITISACRNGAEWRFSVADNGIGIDPQFFKRIFVLFQRLHGKERYPGTGIGLAMCKKIVERHGGRIWVESQQAQGSTFFFTMPENLKPEKEKEEQ